MKRRILLTGFALAPALTLLGCSKSAETGNGYKEIKLGTLSGPHAEIAEVAVKLAANDGLKVKIVEFSDYGHLNEALSTGDIDCNAFQHKPFLDKAAATKGYKFTALGKTVIFPIGIYSAKIRRKEDITDGMLVSVPADAVNLGRGLQLLERNGIIKLRPGTGIHAALTDITENPKHLVFREVDSAYLGRSHCLMSALPSLTAPGPSKATSLPPRTRSFLKAQILTLPTSSLFRQRTRIARNSKFF